MSSPIMPSASARHGPIFGVLPTSCTATFANSKAVGVEQFPAFREQLRARYVVVFGASDTNKRP